MKQIQVLILAGGVGTRMWPIKTSKNLLPFFGQPLLIHQIKRLQKAGFKELTVVVNSEIKSVVEKEKTGVRLVVQPKPRGLTDAILTAEEVLDDRPLLVVNADDFFKLSLLGEIKKKTQDRVDGLLVGQRVKRYFPGGYLIIKANRVVGMVEKPGKGKEPSDMVRLVLDFFRHPKELFKYLKAGRPSQPLYEDALDQMMKSGLNFGLIEYSGPWATVKYPWHVLSLSEFFLNEKKTAVVADKSVRIFEGAVVKNSYLGKNVIIGNNALVRDSIVEDNCVIGYSTEIARSYIGPNCWFHANYVGDSVLEKNISFGSGARAANLRLDEDEIKVEKDGQRLATGRTKLGAIIGAEAKVGINASLMPGVMIGSQSFIGPNLVLKENLAENQFCYLESKLKIKKNLHQFNFQNREEFRKKL